MAIVIVAIGTRGDLQPLAALGLGLQARGHAVRLLIGANFRAWVESQGLAVATTTVDIQGMTDSRWGQEWSERGTNPIRQVRAMQGLVDEFGRELAQDTWRACAEVTAVIGSFTTDTFVASTAERLAVPQLSALLQPATLATRDGAVAMDGPRPIRVSRLNCLTSRFLVEPLMRRLNGRLVNRLGREVLHLPPQGWRASCSATAATSSPTRSVGRQASTRPATGSCRMKRGSRPPRSRRSWRPVRRWSASASAA